jgi:hypothetical protein
MADWKRVSRCKECGMVYPNGIPYICGKCGTEIGRPTPILLQTLGYGEVSLTNKCEHVTAKKKLFGWKVRESEEKTDEMS